VAAGILRADLELHRPHLYDASRFLPVPVTVVGWTDDDVVTVAEVCDGWEECAEVRYVVLDGEHFAFTRCPRELVDLLVRDLAEAPGGAVPTGSPLRTHARTDTEGSQGP
jgi:surfactin synthase thioesterase subunit